MHTIEELANPALLSLAAKKAYRFLDRHSWYFDRSEAAAFLGRLSFNIWLLSEQILADEFRPHTKQLFAAPKKILLKNNGATEYVVRPLASYSFRDQIVETAVLCLYADQFEGQWGNIHNPKYPFSVSFGNRLHTVGSVLEPEFSVGSSKVYRDWSDDYTAFVKGTEAAFNDSLTSLQQNEQVTLLCCDIKSFYPSIRRNLILKKIAASSDSKLNAVLRRLFGRYEVASSTGLDPIEAKSLSSRGLPQGGVHSGFWANVYLADFDQWVRSQLESEIQKKIPEFRLCYYARYVDDMRLIGKYRLPVGPKYKRAGSHPISRTVSSELKRIGLKLSAEKSQLIQQRAGGLLLTTGQIAERMQTIHRRLYVPMPPEDLIELTKDLRLLFHADLQSTQAKNTGSEPHLDNPGVRSDSRWRFSAGRWLKVARELDALNPGWTKKHQAFSSEIVRRWIERPEQVQLLLYALRIGIGPYEKRAISKRMQQLSNDSSAAGYFAYLQAFFFDQASRSDANASILGELPLQVWAIGALRYRLGHPVLVNKARQFLLTRTILKRYFLASFLKGTQDGYCDVLNGSVRGLRQGMLHPSEIASIFAFHSFNNLSRKTLISSSLRFSNARNAKRLLRQLLLSYSNQEILAEVVAIARERDLSIPEMLVFTSLRKRRSETSAESLLTAIRRGVFVSPLNWCRLARELCRILNENDGNHLGTRGLLNPQALSWHETRGLRLVARPTPRLAFSGYVEPFGALGSQRLTPAWCLPTGLLLHAAATRNQRTLMGMSSSQRFRSLCTFRTLLDQGGMLPEEAGTIVTRLYAWPGSRIRPFLSLNSFAKQITVLESNLKSLTINDAVQTTLCDVKRSLGIITDSAFTVVICQISSHPTIVTDITVRRALSVSQTIGREHGNGRSSPRLIVFPELSVPVASLVTLSRFVRATGAMVLAGLELRTDTQKKRQINELVWIVPGDDGDQRPLILRQHKIHITQDECNLRPPVLAAHPAIIWRIGGIPERLAAINCYEFTDLSIRGLLRGRIEALMISANNRDVPTFDNLVESSHYDLFCHVLLVNAERFGGSAIRAPYKEPFKRRIFDIHGGDLFAVNICDLNLGVFRQSGSASKEKRNGLEIESPIKTAPAGFKVR